MTATASCLVATLAALLSGPALLPAPPMPAAVFATLETADGAVYRRQPLVVRLTIHNPGPKTTQVDAAAFAPAAFTLRDMEGNPPRGAAPPAVGEPGGTIDIIGQDKAERRIDLSALYPGLTKKKRAWEIVWSHGGLSAGPLRVAVIEPYDARRDDTALVETDLGVMTWELLTEHAPAHVKNFVDLSRQGHYDGLSIFRVVPGLYAEGGDPKHDGTGAWQHLLMPEISPTLTMQTGLVGAARRETSMTSDTMFFITLGGSEYMKGKQTFFARVTRGLEVLARLHPLPNKGDTGLIDAFLLVEPVRIRRVTIK